jgi:hypothetical protein
VKASNSKNIKTGRYRHYKGKEYQVIGVGVHSETLEEFVVYKPLYEPEQRFKGKHWIRPVENFLLPVEKEGKEIPRFKYIDSDC